MRDLRREFAPALQRLQIGQSGPVGSKGGNEDIRRCYGILYGEIDAHAADGRHRMRRIADAEKAIARPVFKPIDGDAEKLDRFETLEFADAICDRGRNLRDAGAKTVDPCRTNAIEFTFGNDIAALPVIAALDHHEYSAAVEDAKRPVGIPILA